MPCERTGEAKTQVVVAVIARVPVAVRRTHPPGIVVPGAAAVHPLAAV